MSGISYCVITTVRDEEEFIAKTINSMVSQIHRPLLWIIVDDGSQDGTQGILEDASRSYSWIKVLRGERSPHRNACEATALGFNWALPMALELDPGAVVKIDGDMEFGPDYFKRLTDILAAEPSLGIVGGWSLEQDKGGAWKPVRMPKSHVRGATLVFRREVIDQQGGMVVGYGEDTAPLIKARLAGWKTRSVPEVTFYHLRVTGSAIGLLRQQWGKGRVAYVVGYHPLFALLRTARNMLRPPYVLSGVSFLRGFLSGYLERAPRVLTSKEISAFRKEQFKALVGRGAWWQSS